MNALAGLDAFTRGYIVCALWSSTDWSNDEGGEPLDKNYDASDLSPDSLAEMARECEAFQQANAEALSEAYSAREGYGAESAGHDFWLTRNGHGVGFWDRGLGKVGDDLTAECRPYGSSDLYVGDDGRIHVS